MVTDEFYFLKRLRLSFFFFFKQSREILRRIEIYMQKFTSLSEYNDPLREKGKSIGRGKLEVEQNGILIRLLRFKESSFTLLTKESKLV